MTIDEALKTVQHAVEWPGCYVSEEPRSVEILVGALAVVVLDSLNLRKPASSMDAAKPAEVIDLTRGVDSELLDWWGSTDIRIENTGVGWVGYTGDSHRAETVSGKTPREVLRRARQVWG